MRDTPVVFFDLDGTLLTNDHRVAESSVQAIKRMTEKGILSVLATGRTLFEVDYILEETGIRSCVLMNGQYVTHEGEVVYRNPLDTDELMKLHEAADKKGFALVYHTPEKIVASTDESELLKKDLHYCGRDFPRVDSKLYMKEPVYQAEIYLEKGEEAYFQEQFPYLQFVRNSPFGCDVYPATITKASGIQKFLEITGISKENTYAFGDGFNDLEMFQLVGTSIAMENAVDAIKEKATHITKSNEEDGIYHGLKKCGLI
ncbi:Cof-type HAD-IIB family hydrolase [Niallia sp. Krafla_26]|uniref:Cof-type HAD-IIB family hydrolase n=1 Tax=Niallia sp. Krafla_26 TaxID=3064703 RepID=UPI003D16FF58